MTRVRFHPGAEQEVAAAQNWYESRQAGLGAEFLAELERSINLVSQSPAMWPSWPEIRIVSGVRRCLLSRFPYAIAYVGAGDEIVVYAVAHLARRPEYWHRRLP